MHKISRLFTNKASKILQAKYSDSGRIREGAITAGKISCKSVILKKSGFIFPIPLKIEPRPAIVNRKTAT